MVNYRNKRKYVGVSWLFKNAIDLIHDSDIQPCGFFCIFIGSFYTTLQAVDRMFSVCKYNLCFVVSISGILCTGYLWLFSWDIYRLCGIKPRISPPLC